MTKFENDLPLHYFLAEFQKKRNNRKNLMDLSMFLTSDYFSRIDHVQAGIQDINRNLNHASDVIRNLDHAFK